MDDRGQISLILLPYILLPIVDSIWHGQIGWQNLMAQYRCQMTHCDYFAAAINKFLLLHLITAFNNASSIHQGQIDRQNYMGMMDDRLRARLILLQSQIYFYVWNCLQHSAGAGRQIKLYSRSMIKDQGSRIKGQGSRIKDHIQGSRIEDQGPRIKDQESRIKDQLSRINYQGSRIKDQGSRIKDQGSGLFCCNHGCTFNLRIYYIRKLSFVWLAELEKGKNGFFLIYGVI